MDLQPAPLNLPGLTLSTAIIALFFVALRRSVRRAEMRWWAYGWTANAAALSVAALFWHVQPPAQSFAAVVAVYLAARLASVWLLSRGALEFCGARPRMLDAGVMVPPIVAVCVASVFVLTSPERLGLIAHAAMAAGFGTAAAAVWRSRASSASWLAVAFAQRALASAVEATAYGVNAPAGGILEAHQLLGIGAEWLLAMGIVIAVAARTQGDLQSANARMEAAQADLRRLVDRDPLTGLANRRALPDVLRRVQPDGALVIFFDLNDFKKINDEHGHQAGDECLVRFAAALTQCFRPTDTIVRYGGDEFLVVAPGVSETAGFERADSVRARVANIGGGVLPIRFSVGIGKLGAGGNPDEALREADEAMYRAKRKRQPARPRAEMAPQLPLH